jgi:DNA-binding MarR family transcriptional regulator
MKQDLTSLTPLQAETLEYIKIFKCHHGISPTNQEIAEKFGISITSAFERIYWIIRKGYLVKIPGSSRSLNIIEPKVSCTIREEE